MLKWISLCLIAALVGASVTPMNLQAGGGGNRGGSTKPVTVRYVGYITHLQVTNDGILVTVGTSYYSVAANLLIKADTKVKINGSSDSGLSLEVGDYADVTVEWPSKVVQKVEAIQLP